MKQITDTVYFKHKHITQPSISIADTSVTSAMKLTKTITTNMKTSLTDLNLHELEKLAKIFQQAAIKISEKDAQQPRVQNKHGTPRVPICTNTPQIMPAPNGHATSTPNYISDDGSDDKDSKHSNITKPHHYNRRAQKRLQGSIITNTILTLLELSHTELSPQTLSTQRYPMHLLCELARTVMDKDTGEMLEY